MHTPFRRYSDTNMSRGQYDVIWDKSSFLGLVFRCTSQGLCAVRRIDPNAQSQVLEQARVGDVLVAYDNEPNLSFEKIMERLRSAQNPVTMTFAPPWQSLPAYRMDPYNRPSLVQPPIQTDYNYDINANPRHHQKNPARLTKQSHGIDCNDSSVYNRPSLAQPPFAIDYELDKKTTPQQYRNNPTKQSLAIDCDEISGVSTEESFLETYTSFTLVWKEGSKLGVKFIKVGQYATVKERTEKVTDSALAQIQAGDQLMTIQGVNTLDIGYDAAITLLREHKKPIDLSFRRLVRKDEDVQISPLLTTHSRETEYSLIWESGPLGLTLKKDNDKHTIIVSRLNGEGLATRSSLLSIGDVLVSVSNVKVQNLGLRGTMSLLKALPKPIVLIFHRVTGTDVDHKRMSFSHEFTGHSEDTSEQTDVTSASCSAQDQNRRSTTNDGKFYEAIDDQMAQLELEASNADVINELEQSPLARNVENQKLLLQMYSSAKSSYSDIDDSGLLAHSKVPNIVVPPQSNVTISDIHRWHVTVLWSSGPLGIAFKQIGSLIVVSRITGVGTSPGLNELQEGDVLVGINDLTCFDLERVGQELKTLPKPIILHFELQKTQEDL